MKDQELALAKQLIEQISAKAFDPAKYQDDVAKRIHTAIENKVNGKEIVVSATVAPKTNVIDLMEALQASVAATKKEEPKEAAPKSKKKAKTA